jgi:signal transduction histidine kinase
VCREIETMLAIRDWSVRRRLVLAFLVILISNLALIVGAGVWARAIRQHVLAVRHAVTMEAQAASEIRLALPGVTSSVERHLMTREGSDHEQFERNLVRLREALARRNALFGAHPEEGERELLDAVEGQVSRIEALGRELLAVHHRGASGVSSATLDELHRLSDEAAAALAKLQQADLREVEAEIDEGSIVFRWVMTAGLAMLALNMAGGAAVVLLFSSRLNRPINEGLAAINAVAAAVSGSLELQEVLPRVLDIVMAAIGMEAGAVRVLDESSNTLVLTASRGLSRRFCDEANAIGPGEELSDERAERHAPLFVLDASQAPGLERLVEMEGACSLAGVPLIAGDRVVGTMVLLSRRPRALGGPELTLLSAVGPQLGVAIENARLYREAEAQRTRLAQIFDSTSDGIMLVKPQGQIVYANRRAAELLALSPAGPASGGATGAPLGLEDALAGRDGLVTTLRALLEHPDRGGQGDLEITAPTRRVLHWVGRPTKDASGAALGLTLTFQDVTQEWEVNRMKSDFVSFATHQLRTPLAGIKWLLELAVGGADVPDETRSYVQDARESADRLIRLVNDLLDASRLESGRLAVVPRETRLGEVTQGVLGEVEALVRDKGHRLSIAGAEAVPPVLADPQLLRQVIFKLVCNAIRYTLPGGELAIRMSREGSLVRWEIQDSGIGIPREAQRRLFEKFYRADNVSTIETEGTGLGLYLVRLIVERLGGKVRCESAEGKGSTFLFTLPLSE